MKYRYVDNDQQDWTGSAGASDEKPRTARMVRDGRNQAVRVPTDLEIDADEVWIYRVGNRLVIEPKRPTWLSLATDAPPVPDGLLSERPVIGIDPEGRET